jgi:hypothetical protein
MPFRYSSCNPAKYSFLAFLSTQFQLGGPPGSEVVNQRVETKGRQEGDRMAAKGKKGDSKALKKAKKTLKRAKKAVKDLRRKARKAQKAKAKRQRGPATTP